MVGDNFIYREDKPNDSIVFSINPTCEFSLIIQRIHEIKKNHFYVNIHSEMVLHYIIYINIEYSHINGSSFFHVFSE